MDIGIVWFMMDGIVWFGLWMHFFGKRERHHCFGRREGYNGLGKVKGHCF